MQEIGNNTIINKPRLTIRISRNTLSFSAVNPDEPGNIIYEPYTVKSGVSIAANLREAFKAIDLLRNGWQRAMILLDGPVLMLPVDTFNDAAADELFKYSMTGHDNDVILNTVLPSLNAVAVYPINKDLKQVIDDHFSDVRYAHVCTPVWNHLYRRSLRVSEIRFTLIFMIEKWRCSASNRTVSGLLTVLKQRWHPMQSITS